MENESKKSRKKNRLKDFDYSSNASYFETATVIKQFKGAVSKEVGTTVWQKGFYDHIIRDDEDYNTKAQYIDTNPLTWERDELYTER